MKPAVIVDMDGTLVDVTPVRHHVMGRPKNFDAFHRGARTCPPNRVAMDFCERHHWAGRTVLIVTARKYQWEQDSRDWLFEHMTVPFVGPFMRGDDDNRADVEVKRDIHRILTKEQGYQILGACDDNPLIVALWRSLNIPTAVVPGWDTNRKEVAR